MRQLPKPDWIVAHVCTEDGLDMLIVGAWEDRGYVHFKKYGISDFPNNLICLDDLEGLFIDHVDVRTVQQG